jgi:hypothetical protein
MTNCQSAPVPNTPSSYGYRPISGAAGGNKAESAVPISEPLIPMTEPLLPISEPMIAMPEPLLPISEPTIAMPEPLLPISEPMIATSEPLLPISEPLIATTEPMLPISEPMVSTPPELVVVLPRMARATALRSPSVWRESLLPPRREVSARDPTQRRRVARAAYDVKRRSAPPD